MATPKRDNTAQAHLAFAGTLKSEPQDDEILNWAERYAAQIATQMFGFDALPKVFDTTWKYSIKNGKRFQVDMLIAFTIQGHPYKVFVNAETKISSLSELIGRLRLLKSALPYSPRLATSEWLIISPDDRFAAKLKEQGFQFLRYDPAQTFASIGHK